MQKCQRCDSVCDTHTYSLVSIWVMSGLGVALPREAPGAQA
jgi:hypothetical protein